MMLLLAALPALFWDAAPDTFPALRDAGIRQIQVPPERLAAWRSVSGISVEAVDLKDAVKLLTPTVNNRANQATASREPWVDSNGWRFLRQPQARFYYEVTGKTSALVAAEAFSYGARASIKTDAAGLQPLAEMLSFLGGVTPDDMPPLADFGFIDDGSPAAGEVLNLLVRDNLMFRLVTAPDRKLAFTVRLGDKEFPLEDAKNPKMMARQVRTKLTDAKRSLRIYGSTVVVARVTGSGTRTRLQLINYAAATRKVDGLRVRVLGKYPKHKVMASGVPQAELLDYSVDSDATEFTLRELQTYAVIDLSR